MTKSILEVLQSEPIRLMDGRYSGGFVDPKVLENVIKHKRIANLEVYEQSGVDFVRIHAPTTAKEGGEG